MTKDTAVVSVRINSEIREKLEEESDLNNISLNTLLSQILYKHVQWDQFSDQAGYTVTSKNFLKKLLGLVDEKTII